MMEIINDIEKINQSLKWLVSLLNRYGIPYQIIGGLAAKAYGTSRPLVDIDLYAPFDKMQLFLEEIRPYLLREPQAYHSPSWDITYLVLVYQNVRIEIVDTDTNPRYYNRVDQCWEAQNIDFSQSAYIKMYDVEIAVMPKDQLIRYKTGLDREVDRQDVQELHE